MRKKIYFTNPLLKTREEVLDIIKEYKYDNLRLSWENKVLLRWIYESSIFYEKNDVIFPKTVRVCKFRKPTSERGFMVLPSRYPKSFYSFEKFNELHKVQG